MDYIQGNMDFINNYMAGSKWKIMKLEIFNEYVRPYFKFPESYYRKETGVIDNTSQLLGKRAIRCLNTSLENNLKIFFCCGEHLGKNINFTKEDDKALNTI